MRRRRPGSASSQEDPVYIVEPFRSVGDYGVAYDRMFGGTRRAINATSSEVMECDPPRLYLSDAVYWPIVSSTAKILDSITFRVGGFFTRSILGLAPIWISHN